MGACCVYVNQEWYWGDITTHPGVHSASPIDVPPSPEREAWYKPRERNVIAWGNQIISKTEAPLAVAFEF